MIKYPVRLGPGEDDGWRPTIVDYHGNPVIGLEATDLDRHSEPRTADGRRADWAMAEKIVIALNAMNEFPAERLLGYVTTPVDTYSAKLYRWYCKFFKE